MRQCDFYHGKTLRSVACTHERTGAKSTFIATLIMKGPCGVVPTTCCRHISSCRPTSSTLTISLRGTVAQRDDHEQQSVNVTSSLGGFAPVITDFINMLLQCQCGLTSRHLREGLCGELKALACATQVLQAETGAADELAYSLIQRAHICVFGDNA